MDTKCSTNCINCCFCNCFNSITVTILELISSLIGTGLTSYLFKINQFIHEKSKFLYSLPFINISYFGSSSVIITIILVLKKLQKIEQIFFYKFSKICSFIYIILSKALALFNLFSFFYLLCFTSVVTFSVAQGDYYIYKDVITNVEYECQIKDVDCGIHNAKDEELTPNIDYIDFAIFIFSIFFSSFLTYYNGASFSSENKRITYLIKGKLNIELYQTESSSICSGRWCDFLNMLICYKLTLIQTLRYLSLVSIILFINGLILLILALKHPWPQAELLGIGFLNSMNIPYPFLVFLASLYCKGSDWCDKDNPPSKRKCCMLLLLIVSILMFPAQLLNLVSIISSQIGTSRIQILITFNGLSNVPDNYDDSFDYYLDYAVSGNYYAILSIKQASFGKILVGLILGIIPTLCSFFIIVLLVNYIHRALFEYNTPNRSYSTKLYLIGENGEKFDINDFEVFCSSVKVKKNINGKEVEEEQQIYSRRALNRNIGVQSSDPIIYNIN